MTTIKLNETSDALPTYLVNTTTMQPVIGAGDGVISAEQIDAFGRLRVSEPLTLFDTQFTYTLQSLVFEQVTNGTGAAIAHNATERSALLTFASTPTGGKAYMQSYQFSRYQPSKSQEVRVTFAFKEAVANCLKFAGLCDGLNGYRFENTGSVNRFAIYSTATNGNVFVTQANWNIDKMDGTGASGYTLDITKSQHYVVDFQALYVGRVRMGFDIGGAIVYCHEFKFSNVIAGKYIAYANLPIQCGMTCTGTVSTTMDFICCAIVSEGGQNNPTGYEFAVSGNGTAASGVMTHFMSIRPKLLFNGLTNRVKIGMIEVDIMVTGSNPVRWQLVIGQAITGTTTYADVNTLHSAMEYNTAGTASGSPVIVLDDGYIAATTQSKGTQSMVLTSKYPITLDAAGLQRLNGTLSLLISGIGGTSTCYASVKISEER